MRRRRRSSGGVSRRKLLLGVGAALSGAGLTSTGAYSAVDAPRAATISTVSDPDAIVGMYVYDQVEKKSTDPLIDVTNNYTETLKVTISLADCTQGTLEAPDGETGCTVTSTVDPGKTRTWYFTSDVGNETTVSFDVDATATDFDFQARRSTTAVNKSENAVVVDKFQLASGNPEAVDATNDQFNIKKIKISDNDNDADVNRRKFTVTDTNGNSVSLNDSEDDPDRTFAETDEWKEGGANDPITLQADENLSTNETYDIKLTGYDVDENRASETKST